MRDGTAPLSGFTIGITAERSAGEIGAMFERRGARVRYAPAMHTIPLPEDGELALATEAVLEAPVDAVVAMTGVGFRGWLEAADHRGVGDRLRAHLRPAWTLARGAKARGAVRGAGLPDPWTAETEESAEVLGQLLSAGVAGKRVAVQLHGDRMAEFRSRLAEAGAQVVPVRVYRWTDPADLGPLDGLIRSVVAGEIGALPFTSAVAAENTLDRAERTGQREALHDVLGTRVLVACVGPVTARPFETAGIPTVQPERARTASLVRLVADRLPEFAVARE